MLTELSKPREPLQLSNPIFYSNFHPTPTVTNHNSAKQRSTMLNLCYTKLNNQVLPYSGPSTRNHARSHTTSQNHTNHKPPPIRTQSLFVSPCFSSSNVGVSQTRVRCYTKQYISAILYVHFKAVILEKLNDNEKYKSKPNLYHVLPIKTYISWLLLNLI